MDLGDLSVPAQMTPLDMQVSIDGLDLFPTAGNTATAYSGFFGDIAIAIGNGAVARALNGFGDFAFADGTNSTALAGEFTFEPTFLGNFDLAVAVGDGLTASAINANFVTDILGL
jgi:hypothetical protein